MNSEQATTAVIEALEALRVPYMLTGALSSNFYGVPRATQDADFVLQLEGTSINDIVARLQPAMELDPQMSFEAVTATQRYVLKLRNHPFKVELFLLSEDAYDQQRFGRRKRVEILGQQSYVPSAEDVVINKLRWSLHGRRTKDIDDARHVMAVQREHLDWDYIRQWSARHGTLPRLEQILAAL